MKRTIARGSAVLALGIAAVTTSAFAFAATGEPAQFQERSSSGAAWPIQGSPEPAAAVAPTSPSVAGLTARERDRMNASRGGTISDRDYSDGNSAGDVRLLDSGAHGGQPSVPRY